MYLLLYNKREQSTKEPIKFKYLSTTKLGHFSFHKASQATHQTGGGHLRQTNTNLLVAIEHHIEMQSSQKSAPFFHQISNRFEKSENVGRVETTNEFKETNLTNLEHTQKFIDEIVALPIIVSGCGEADGEAMSTSGEVEDE